MLLAIDTSTSEASLALSDDAGVRAQRTWHIGQAHSVQILGAIDDLLKGSEVRRADVTGVAVATGPGSFNGLRVAVTVAKILAFVWDIPLIGVATPDAIAQVLAIREQALILVVLEAGRGELYVAWYDSGWYDQLYGAGIVRRYGAITISTPTALVAAGMLMAPERPIIIAGEMASTRGQELADLLGKRARFAPLPEKFNRALGVGIIARARLAAGERDAVMNLEPLYVRRPNITASTRHPLPATFADGDGGPREVS